jgi:hypothetical protein
MLGLGIAALTSVSKAPTATPPPTSGTAPPTSSHPPPPDRTTTIPDVTTPNGGTSTTTTVYATTITVYATTTTEAVSTGAPSSDAWTVVFGLSSTITGLGGLGLSTAAFLRDGRRREPDDRDSVE